MDAFPSNKFLMTMNPYTVEAVHCVNIILLHIVRKNYRINIFRCDHFYRLCDSSICHIRS